MRSSPAETGLIVPAAGSGERLGVDVPKAMYALGGETLLVRAVSAAVSAGVASSIVVAVPPGWSAPAYDLVRAKTPDHIGVRVVDGAASRQASVRAALAALPDGVDTVLVHDAARCLAPTALFADVLAAIRGGHHAVVPGLAVVDTLKRVDANSDVVATPDRARLRAVQTPQGFSRGVLTQAHETGTALGEATDDAALVERIGQRVHVVPGDDEAFKITRPLDLLLAEAVLARRPTREREPWE